MAQQSQSQIKHYSAGVYEHDGKIWYFFRVDGALSGPYVTLEEMQKYLLQKVPMGNLSVFDTIAQVKGLLPAGAAVWAEFLEGVYDGFRWGESNPGGRTKRIDDSTKLIAQLQKANASPTP
ncbi:hypothetical protein C0075_06645 [Rhizobium sp. KAs_5_22]|uniref:hypothetical protein n=1 Tax=Ciceribacter selenitireducens TaxID=448181 RepID=UPI000490A2C2|nr:hypothetical protein [Ciceribacter selenitireducens]PPJ45432.1 hypothetical protein C0075_06645 [Rhizobium sp. KAs_5_22]